MNKLLAFREKREYFMRNYSKMYDDAIKLRNSFQKLMSTYEVDETNKDEFNCRKNAIEYYAKHLKKKVDIFENEIKSNCQLDRETRQKRKEIKKILEEIISMCK